MKIHFRLILAIWLVIPFTACHKHPAEKPSSVSVTSSAIPSGIEVADTIIYQVVISNPNPEDEWTTRCLKGLNRKSLVDSIFNMVYEGKLTAVNHDTHEKITIKQLKDIEKAEGFTRDKIGMIQFTEAWYLDPAIRAMTKKVLAMDLGYDYHPGDGDMVVYKSLFRVEMK
jgi:hypothetical protein